MKLSNKFSISSSFPELKIEKLLLSNRKQASKSDFIITSLLFDSLHSSAGNYMQYLCEDLIFA